MGALNTVNFAYELNNERSTAPMQIFAARLVLPALNGEVERLVVVAGSDHDHSPTPELAYHPKYLLGISLIEDWLEQTQTHPDRRRFVYEGRDVIPQNIADVPTAITEGNGEPGVIQYFARRQDIKAVSGEPPLEEELRVALIENNPVAVSTFLGTRFVPWIKDSYGTSSDISNYLRPYTNIIPDISLNNFEAGFKATFNVVFREEDYLDPDNPIVAQCNMLTKDYYRNPQLLEAIKNPRLKKLAEIALTIQYARSRSLGSAIVKAATGNETKSESTTLSDVYGSVTNIPTYTNPSGVSHDYDADLAESVFAWYGMSHAEVIGKAILQLGIRTYPFIKHLQQYRTETREPAGNAADRKVFSLKNLLLPTPPLTNPEIKLAEAMGRYRKDTDSELF